MTMLDIKQMRDSKEMLEAKPHHFFSIFTYLLIAVLTAALAWAYYGEIDVYVKGRGIVRPNENISAVKNVVFGKVAEIFVEEGRFVKKGDVLYTIETKSIDLQMENQYQEKAKIENELADFVHTNKA